MQNKFDGWVPLTTEDGTIFYGKTGHVSQWEPPFPGWVFTSDPNGVLNAVHATTHKKVYSLLDINLENLKIDQEAEQKLQAEKHEAKQKLQAEKHEAERRQYRTNPALLAILEPEVNPFPGTGRDVRLRKVQPSGKIIWAPGGLNTWSVYLRNPDFSTWGQEHQYKSIITRGRDDGLNLMHTNEFFGKYKLVCGIMDVADIRVFLPDRDTDDKLKFASDEASRAFTIAHTRVTTSNSSYYVDNYYNAANEKARAAANIALAGWVPARPYQTFAYLDFMYGRGTEIEIKYFATDSSSLNDVQKLIAQGSRRIKMLNGDDYWPGVNGAITITMLMRDNGSIYYRNEDGEEVLMSCTPLERETIYMQPRQLPRAAPAAPRSPATASRSCWPFCRRSSRVLPAEAEGGRNRNKRRNRKQRTIKKHKNNKNNKHNKHKKRSIQQQSTR